jgi:hypothetical protein
MSEDITRRRRRCQAHGRNVVIVVRGSRDRCATHWSRGVGHAPHIGVQDGQLRCLWWKTVRSISRRLTMRWTMAPLFVLRAAAVAVLTIGAVTAPPAGVALAQAGEGEIWVDPNDPEFW